jgi:hypothetical protein
VGVGRPLLNSNPRLDVRFDVKKDQAMLMPG